MNANQLRARLIVMLGLVILLAPVASGQTATDGAGGQPARPAGRAATRPDAQPAAAAPRTGGNTKQPAPPAGSAAVPRAGAQVAASNTRPIGPRPPFELTATQQQLLDQILIKWEKQSEKVKTFKCSFQRWEYDPTWGPEKYEGCISDSFGDIKYAAPDRGEYMISKMLEYDQNKQSYTAKTEGLDQWVCTGKAIFEFNSTKKQLIERPLPPEMQGKAISEGPLPFIFGANKEQLNRRYWMRDVTPKDEIGKSVWLEAFPKFQHDAANFQRAVVILNDADFIPMGLQIFPPGIAAKNTRLQPANTSYRFDNSKVNNWTGTWDFTAPRLSATQKLSGWKHVVEDETTKDSKDTPPPTGDAKQARRPKPPVDRK
jgi:TIGR03009 family protein